MTAVDPASVNSTFKSQCRFSGRGGNLNSEEVLTVSSELFTCGLDGEEGATIDLGDLEPVG